MNLVFISIKREDRIRKYSQVLFHHTLNTVTAPVMKMLMRVINKRYDMDNAVRKGTQVNESLIYVNTTVCMLHSLPQQGVATNTLYTVENP